MRDSNKCFYGNAHEKIDAIFERADFRVSADSAFNAQNRDSMVKSTPEDELGLRTLCSRENTSIRQLSEWGMRAIQGSFPRLLDDILYEEHGERHLTLHLVLLFHNFKTRCIGINQINNSFMLHLLLDSKYFTGDY